MVKAVNKYNPGFLSEEELIQSFAVRHMELELLLERIRENTTESNQHLMLIGPRGSGKTTLVLRIIAEIHRDSQLNALWYPLIFGEESYEVVTAGELWLEGIFHLYQQTHQEKWQRSYEDLKKNELDETRLYQRALTQLLDFADEQNKRILLVLENLNMLMGDQLSEESAWSLRHTLMNEPRIMLLGTATNRFKEIENSEQAWYELFETHELKPLNNEDCQTMWQSITGKKAKDIRPIRILTGGNSRLLAIISTFGADISFRHLMDSLIQLVDDHTDYFKSHLEYLPPLERKVFVSLLNIWDPATTQEIAQATRINGNKVSSFLGRLLSRGAVVIADQSGRKKWYQVAERMYNIYYLMRRHGQPSNRVRGVVNFVVNFYDSEELVNVTSTLARESLHLNQEHRKEHYLAYESILKKVSSLDIQSKILKATPHQFFESPDIPQEFQNYSKQRKNLVTEEAYHRAIAEKPDDDFTWIKLGVLLHQKLKKYEEAEQAYRKAIELQSSIKEVWALLGALLHLDLEKYKEAEQAYRKAIELQSCITEVWPLLGSLLHNNLRRYEEAEKAYLKAIELDPDHNLSWIGLISLYIVELNKPKLGLQSAGEYLDQQQYSAESLNSMARLFFQINQQEHFPQAEIWAREAIEKAPLETTYLHSFASILGARGKWEEALAIALRFLTDSTWIKNNTQEIVDLFVSSAAAGHAEKSLLILEDSTGAENLEPLIVALKLSMGTKVRAAQEIMEVAKDVLDIIKARKEYK